MRRGEIWLINLDPTVGAEIRKVRPAIVVSSDHVGILPLRIIVPLTSWKDRYALAPWMVRVDLSAQNGLDQPSAADAFQVRSVSETRFVRCLGTLAEQTLRDVVQAVAFVLEATAG
jgi:mRNA interferase MazF